MVLEREREGRVEILTLNRPESANAMDGELLTALGDALDELEEDDGAWVVVLTGAGRHFCGGMDLRAFSEQGGGGGGAAPQRRPSARRGLGMFTTPFTKPLIAAVNGAAVGGGFELVMLCDLVVAADVARFGLPEVRRGLFASGGGTLLSSRIPLARALELGMTGELIGAAQAAEWGLVNRVVPLEELLSAALELASAVAANGPLGVQTTKRLLRRAVVDPAQPGWATEEEMAAVFQSEDASEGARAFVEKRPPNFRGR
jgi:enoyl-CoA hydratase